MTAYQLAQLNLAHMQTSLDDPSMADFVTNLVRINQLGAQSPGFVWILEDESGTATALRPFGDDILINLTVWESIDALYQYTYYSDHAELFRRRREWFHKHSTPMVVLWWIPAGQRPTVEDARERLEHLRAHGPTPYAFTFKQRFDPPTDPETAAAPGERLRAE